MIPYCNRQMIQLIHRYKGPLAAIILGFSLFLDRPISIYGCPESDNTATSNSDYAKWSIARRSTDAAYKTGYSATHNGSGRGHVRPYESTFRRMKPIHILTYCLLTPADMQWTISVSVYTGYICIATRFVLHSLKDYTDQPTSNPISSDTTKAVNHGNRSISVKKKNT